MHDFRLSILKPRYEQLFASCQIRSSWLDRIAGVAESIVNRRSQYETLASQTTVPWWFIATLHYREGNFGIVHLHNGDPLTGRTIHFPEGRPIAPPANGMSYTFVESVVDAMQMMKYDKAKDRSIAAWLWRYEMWDGFDYATRGINSEYLWNGTNHYGSGSNQGKVLIDGQFDPNAKSDQVGTAAILWYLLHKGMIDSGTGQPLVTSSTASVQTNAPILLLNVLKYYRQLPHQNKAIAWLQQQLPNDLLVEFARRWRVSPTSGTTTGQPIQLINVLSYYRRIPHQDAAIIWLQHQLPDDLLTEFARQWRTHEQTLVGANVPSPPPPVPVPAAIASTVAKVQKSAENVTRTTGIVQLKVPYLSQLDNTLNPYGTCNVTCVSMCMAYFGHPIRNSQGKQLEDELNEYCDSHGLDRHVPHDLAQILKAYGYKDDFQPNAKWEDVKKWLDQGNPCITHGYFTGSGHIIAIIGYNEKGWIVNDPYGEWFSSGYDTSRSGAGLTYSYGMMREKCGSDGDLWIHYVSK